MNKEHAKYYNYNINNLYSNILIKCYYKTDKTYKDYYEKISKYIIKNNNEYNNYMKKIYSIYSSQNLENNNLLIKNESNSDDTLIQENESDVELEEKILILLSNSSIEWGILSDFDKFIIDNIDERVLNIIQRIFYDNINNEIILEKILNALEEVEYEKVKPYGQMMAIVGFSHKSSVVKQKAVEAFESWKSEDSIKALESVNFSEPWMQKYVNKIINNLKKEVI